QAADRDASRAELGVHDDDVLASYVGTTGMAHSLGTLVTAAGLLRLRVPELRILIVGDGAELAALRDVASRQGLSNVMFTGLVPHEKVPGILAASDMALVTLKPCEVFKAVLPSKMFEAMAAARPIVLAVEGEAQAVLEHAGAGIAVQPGDAAAMAAAIARLASDRHQRARMGQAGGSFVARGVRRTLWAAPYLSLPSKPSAAGSGA